MMNRGLTALRRGEVATAAVYRHDASVLTARRVFRLCSQAKLKEGKVR
jgi:hypothetical protein